MRESVQGEISIPVENLDVFGTHGELGEKREPLEVDDDLNPALTGYQEGADLGSPELPPVPAEPPDAVVLVLEAATPPTQEARVYIEPNPNESSAGAAKVTDGGDSRGSLVADTVVMSEVQIDPVTASPVETVVVTEHMSTHPTPRTALVEPGLATDAGPRVLDENASASGAAQTARTDGENREEAESPDQLEKKPDNADVQVPATQGEIEERPGGGAATTNSQGAREQRPELPALKEDVPASIQGVRNLVAEAASGPQLDTRPSLQRAEMDSNLARAQGLAGEAFSMAGLQVSDDTLSCMVMHKESERSEIQRGVVLAEDGQTEIYVLMDANLKGTGLPLTTSSLKVLAPNFTFGNLLRDDYGEFPIALGNGLTELVRLYVRSSPEAMNEAFELLGCQPREDCFRIARADTNDDAGYFTAGIWTAGFGDMRALVAKLRTPRQALHDLDATIHINSRLVLPPAICRQIGLGTARKLVGDYDPFFFKRDTKVEEPAPILAFANAMENLDIFTLPIFEAVSTVNDVKPLGVDRTIERIRNQTRVIILDTQYTDLDGSRNGHVYRNLEPLGVLKSGLKPPDLSAALTSIGERTAAHTARLLLKAEEVRPLPNDTDSGRDERREILEAIVNTFEQPYPSGVRLLPA